MSRDWKNWLSLQDQRIKSAQSSLVKTELRRLKPKEIPRAVAADVADLARRLNDSVMMLKLLQPYVRPERLKAQAPLAREQALFALALARIGAYREANEIFASLNGQDKSLSLLKASALVSQWEYHKAAPIYRRLLKLRTLSINEVYVAKINLASCLIHGGDHGAALKILEEFDRLRDSYVLLYANSLELRAQALFGLERYEDGAKLVRQSFKLLEPAEAEYSLFARKWLLIIDSYQNQKLSPEWPELTRIAQAMGDFETCRDLDLYRSCLLRDRQGFLQVYFGTPFKSYRSEALKRFGTGTVIPKTYVFGTKDSSPPLNLVTGGRDGSPERLKGIRLMVMRALCRDFYRPIPMGELFAAVYPDQKFDVFTSPHRLFQMVQRLRLELKSMKLPPTVELLNNCYRVALNGQAIETRLQYEAANDSVFGFQEWLRMRGSRPFTRGELETAAGLSRRKAMAWIRHGQMKKWIRATGGGRRVVYHLQPKIRKTSS